MSVENSESNREKCACPGCPSYDSCMSGAGELVFCAAGESRCTVERLGCKCPTCVVYRQNELKSLYYCVAGAAS